jgi:hypothetical protein
LRTSAAGLGGVAYTNGVEPAWVDVSSVRLTLPRLSLHFHGYRVAQISDIHMLDWMTPARFAQVVNLVNAQNPDLIAITGDFVTGHAENAAPVLIQILSTLKARDGIVAVLGNHDHWSNPGVIRSVLQQTGIINVSNTVHTLQRGAAILNIAGVDDVWQRQHRLDLVMEKLPREGAALLLAHEPDFADTSATTGRFDLQISGHSHGGQVVVPFVGPPRLPPFASKYPSGLYRVGDMFQYTNRGVGMVRPYVRFNCRPEITLFTLQAQGAS